MIGIFDSGYGGLTVLKEIINKLPQYDYVYLGDNARAPYGSKSQKVIFNYAKEAVDFLFENNCELVIIACNTASSEALRKIQQEFLPTEYPDKKVLGVIIPTVEAAVEKISAKKNKSNPKIGIIGTKATINSQVFNKEFAKFNISGLEIYSQAAPLLVPLIEENWLKKPETKMILKKYLRPLKIKKIQILIPACTHYPILDRQMKKIIGKNTEVLNIPQAITDKLENYLQRHPEIEKKLPRSKKRIFYTTDETEKFKNFGKNILGIEINDCRQINF